MDSPLPARAQPAKATRWRERHKFTRCDWIGDALITIAAGLVIVAGVVLPWANDDNGHQVNLSLTKPETIRPALATDWGVIVLCLGIAVFALGALMLALGPRRLAAPCGAMIAAAGVTVVVVAFRAAAPMAPYHTPGLGIYIDVLAGILVVPTGFTVSVVGCLLAAETTETAPWKPAPHRLRRTR
jgi:hypothetical protein